MKISYHWLNDFIDIDILAPDPQEVAKALTLLGMAVEGLERSREDWVFDLDVVSNRPDCLNHLGVARELSAYYRLKLKKPEFDAPPEALDSSRFPAEVRILDSDLCPRYAARVVTGIRVEESPNWLRTRLEAVGQRPINNVVDITNYVLLELGHPLHAFDYEGLSGRKIVVRRAREGETLITLDGEQHELTPAMLAICDARNPTALAGVMGGAASEISEKTSTMLLESAYFQPAGIRRTAQALKVSTEASYRFERGADPEMPVRALNRACRLLEELAGGKCVGPVIDVNPLPFQPEELSLSSRRIKQVTGIDIEAEFIERCLGALEFEVVGEDARWIVKPPSFRSDIELEDDLVEEVLRHYGYDKIESTYAPALEAGRFLETEPHDRVICRSLEGWGFYEAVNLAFSTPASEQIFWGRASEMVSIRNPLTNEDSHLRTSLIPGLVKALRRNTNYGNRDVRLFEIGHVFRPAEPPEEEPMLALVAGGDFYDPYWRPDSDPVSFFHLKGLLDAVLRGLGVVADFEREQEVAFLHPGVSAAICSKDGVRIGCAGRLHPRVEESFKFRTPVYVAELRLKTIYAAPLPVPVFKPLERFPSIERDLSFVVDIGVEYDRIMLAIKSLNIADLRKVQLIDFYKGPKLPPQKVGLTVRLTFGNPERTLTQDEVARAGDEVLSALKAGLGVELRS